VATFELFRIRSTETETMGVLHINGKLACYTIEPPFRGNQDNISCIPDGAYDVVLYNSPSKGMVPLLLRVPERDYIEIHVGNTAAETEGCILPGMMPGHLGGKPAVIKSKEAFGLVVAAMGKTKQSIVIKTI